MMLRSFPMDWQSCPLVVGSCKSDLAHAQSSEKNHLPPPLRYIQVYIHWKGGVPVQPRLHKAYLHEPCICVTWCRTAMRDTNGKNPIVMSRGNARHKWKKSYCCVTRCRATGLSFFVYIHKIILEYFGGPWNGNSWYTYFMAVWNILWQFGIFYASLVYFVVIWLIFHFGILYQEKSGNPGMYHQESAPPKCSIFLSPWFIPSVLSFRWPSVCVHLVVSFLLSFITFYTFLEGRTFLIFMLYKKVQQIGPVQRRLRVVKILLTRNEKNLVDGYV
jgi:hypothetical protein